MELLIQFLTILAGLYIVAFLIGLLVLLGVAAYFVRWLLKGGR